ncbi:unnamed protein product [Gadus morhua 'NCC']
MSSGLPACGLPTDGRIRLRISRTTTSHASELIIRKGCNNARDLAKPQQGEDEKSPHLQHFYWGVQHRHTHGRPVDALRSRQSSGRLQEQAEQWTPSGPGRAVDGLRSRQTSGRPEEQADQWTPSGAGRAVDAFRSRQSSGRPEEQADQWTP